jgi:hypothetical protein
VAVPLLFGFTYATAKGEDPPSNMPELSVHSSVKKQSVHRSTQNPFKLIQDVAWLMTERPISINASNVSGYGTP